MSGLESPFLKILQFKNMKNISFQITGKSLKSTVILNGQTAFTYSNK
jgi:hypothetical protein